MIDLLNELRSEVYLASSGRVRQGLFTYDSRLLSRKGHGTIRIVETTRSDTRLLGVALGSGQKRHGASCCPAKQQDIPDVQPLQSMHRSLLHAPTPFHTTYDSNGNLTGKSDATTEVFRIDLDMKAPIFVYEPNDLGVFESLSDAELKIEPVDVRESPFFYYDAEGQIVTASVVTDENGIERTVIHETAEKYFD